MDFGSVLPLSIAALFPAAGMRIATGVCRVIDSGKGIFSGAARETGATRECFGLSDKNVIPLLRNMPRYKGIGKINHKVDYFLTGDFRRPSPGVKPPEVTR